MRVDLGCRPLAHGPGRRAGQLVRRAIPAEKTIRSVSRLVPSTKISLWRRASPSTISLGVLLQVTPAPSASILRRQEPAGGIVELNRHQARRDSTIGGSEAEVLTLLAAFQPEQPPR